MPTAYSESDWRGRSRYWNSQCRQRWDITTEQKGANLPIPANITHLPIWYAWGRDVGDWREAQRYRDHKRSLTSQSIYQLITSSEHDVYPRMWSVMKSKDLGKPKGSPLMGEVG